MALKTTLEQLEEVQTAISTILNGGAQSYTIAGRTFTRANLKDLEDREKRLQKQYNQEQGKRPALSSMNLKGMGY